MRVMLTGASGQLGQELQRTVSAGIELTALSQRDLDVCDESAVRVLIGDARPDVVINAAAYTAVDAAEHDTETAFAVNAIGAGLLGKAAAAAEARLIHLSTDFVFDGRQSKPYRPDDTPNPLSVYGASKREGEILVHSATGGRALILRSSWIYSRYGSNFVKTMLRNMESRSELSVVADQVGTPTWAGGLALAIWDFVRMEDAGGIHHWTDAGVASWYDFAVEIAREAKAQGILKRDVSITPIDTSEFPAAAVRPHFSVLDKSSTWSALGRVADHWQVSLSSMLEEFKTDYCA